jgi:CRP-like cAMP-binding protein
MSALAAPLLQRRGSLAVVGSDRPLILERRQMPEPCAHCGARSYSVCGAIEDADIGQLATLAVVTEVDGGRTFIEEGQSAESFFNITSGTAKVYKLLPDGRRQITGLVGPGDFLGLAVSATYGFSAEAVGPVRFCRFSRPKLRKLLIEFPSLQQRLLELAERNSWQRRSRCCCWGARPPASGWRAFC